MEKIVFTPNKISKILDKKIRKKVPGVDWFVFCACENKVYRYIVTDKNSTEIESRAYKAFREIAKELNLYLDEVKVEGLISNYQYIFRERDQKK